MCRDQESREYMNMPRKSWAVIVPAIALLALIGAACADTSASSPSQRVAGELQSYHAKLTPQEVAGLTAVVEKIGAAQVATSITPGSDYRSAASREQALSDA